MRGRLRICLDARLPGGAAGGIEQFVIGMASGLSKLADDGEEYLFLAYSGLSGWLLPFLGGPCRTLEVPPPRALPGWRKWTVSHFKVLDNVYGIFAPYLGRPSALVRRSDGTIEKAQVDVMHFTFQLAFQTDIPSVYQPHDLQHVHFPQYFTRLQRVDREIIFRAFCRQASMIPVVSSWTKNDIVAHYGVDPGKVRVIPYASLLDEYGSPSNDEVRAARSKFSLPEAFAFYPAATWPHKNHIGLVKSLAILKQRQGIVVPLVSSGFLNEHHADVLDAARAYGVDDQVKFLGYVSPLELHSLYKLCRCVVIPTKFEAASFPLWEAFSAGAPAACSNVTSLPLQAGDAALVFDPDDPEGMARCIRRLWVDEDLRRALIDKGRKRIANLSWERTARTFRAHYRRIAGRDLSGDDRALIDAPVEI